MGFAVLVVVLNGSLLFALWSTTSLKKHLTYPELAFAFFSCAAIIKAHEQGYFGKWLVRPRLQFLFVALALLFEAAADYGLGAAYASIGWKALMPMMVVLWFVNELGEILDERPALLLAVFSFALAAVSGGLYQAGMKNGQGLAVQVACFMISSRRLPYSTSLTLPFRKVTLRSR